MSSFLYFNDPETLVKNTKIDFSENSKKILERRYLRKNEKGELSETPDQMFDRVATAVSAPDMPYRDSRLTQIEFYNLMSTRKFFPNSPTFTGAGTPLGQLAACFVLPIEDDIGKGRDGIFSTLRVASLIQQSGGGNGFSFSKLRSKGSIVRSSNGVATGPVGFLEVYDKAFGEIAQGGVRRGANMAVLRCDHPDIRDFIKCKSAEGSIRNFNISVAATDEFMEAVKKDTTYALVDPHTKEVKETPRAREIFDLIVEYSHKNGEPGILFVDVANRQNPVPHLYELEATNPCGEQWLGPYENCCLGSINLAAHLDKENKLDWDELRKTVILSTRFLDNVVTANKYIPVIPELGEAAHSVRRIGLGFMGLADVMYARNVRYGSDAGQEFAAQVTEFIRFYSMKTSIELAKERGPFPKISGSIYDPQNIKWTPPVPLKEFKRDWGRPNLDWGEILSGIKEHGIRNGAQTTVAPTGVVSTVAGVEGYGCEPVFALAYYRNVYQAAAENENLTLAYVSPFFQRALETLNLDEKTKKRIIDEVIQKGSCQGIKELPEHIKNTFVVSADITPEEHILMQASIQAFVDNSISKTCNFPETAKKEDVAKAYQMGWELGCKGLTVYVTGSRQEVVLETKETKEKKEKIEMAFKPADRGYKLSGNTYKVLTPQGRAFITINRSEKGHPMEVFLNVGKAGSDVAALAEALGRMLSGWFRASYDAKETVKEVVSQLSGIGGLKSIGFGKNKVTSIPDAVAKVLSDEFEVTTKFSGNYDQKSDKDKHEIRQRIFFNTDMCPDCGNYSLVKEEGCEKCYLCGYSAC